MKFNNKILSIVFIGLLAIYLFQKLVNKPEARSFRDVLVEVDTSLVNKIVFTPKGGAAAITLSKNDQTWSADNGLMTVDATTQSVFSLLGPATNIKALQLVSKNKDKWVDYEVDDVNGKKVELYNGNNLLSAFYVGRFNFNQNTRSAKTYMRLAEEDDIYVVDGFLSMSYDKQFNDFRNKQLINTLDKVAINRLALSSDQVNFSLEKDLNNQWITNENTILDSLRSNQVMNSIMNMRGNEILDGYVPNQNNRLAQLTLSDANQNNETIDIYTSDSGFVIHSNSNQGCYFKSDSAGVFKTAYLDILALLDK